jgi:hypothetical protein
MSRSSGIGMSLTLPDKHAHRRARLRCRPKKRQARRVREGPQDGSVTAVRHRQPRHHSFREVLYCSRTGNAVELSKCKGGPSRQHVLATSPAARVQHLKQQRSRLRPAFRGQIEGCLCLHGRQFVVVPKFGIGRRGAFTCAGSRHRPQDPRGQCSMRSRSRMGREHCVGAARATTFWPHRQAATVQHLKQQQSRLRPAFRGQIERCLRVHGRRFAVVPKFGTKRSRARDHAAGHGLRLGVSAGAGPAAGT